MPCCAAIVGRQLDVCAIGCARTARNRMTADAMRCLGIGKPPAAPIIRLPGQSLCYHSRSTVMFRRSLLLAFSLITVAASAQTPLPALIVLNKEDAALVIVDP